MVYKPEDGHCTGVVPKTIEIVIIFYANTNHI
jgi:hypothetical protein